MKNNWLNVCMVIYNSLYLYNNKTKTKTKEDMKNLTTTLLIIIVFTLNCFGQTLPEMVEKGVDKELVANKSKFSKVDFDNIDQGILHKLIVSKIRKEQIKRNPLLLFKGEKLKTDLVAYKSAKHHGLYQSVNNVLTHKEKIKQFKSFDNRFGFYDKENSKFAAISEVCTKFKPNKILTYNELANIIINNYMNSMKHKAILMCDYIENYSIGTFVSVSKNGTVYNTIVFCIPTLN